ncbi:MAG: alpha/beta hydrolase [Opitutaceae bacterium]|nr:alpha/beta hydrolase [Cytophagales bacterium]
MGNLLNFTSKGKGKIVVFLHGFCESVEIWDHFVNSFTEEFQVVCIDLPGHGKSEALGENTYIENIADLVNETMLSITPDKFILVGHSLGGYVTLAYAEKYFQNLAGFCLFHSSAYEDAPDKKENRNKTAEYVKKHGVEAFSNPFVPALFYRGRKEELKDSIIYATKIALKMKSENIVNTIYAMRDRKDRITVLQETNLPVAFIVGKEDTGVPLEKSLAQCYLPQQSSVLFLAETGHMGMFERQIECSLFLKGFFGQVFGNPNLA